MGRRAAGFTLIEAMIVLGIVALTATLGIPAFGDMLQRQRINAAMSLLSSDMAMARSTAIMRRDTVVICPRDEMQRCRSDGDWGAGWIVFTDDDGNRQPDASADILRSEDAPSQGSMLSLRSTRPFLRFQRDGRSANSNLTVNLCARGTVAGKVVVNNLGRVRTERPQDEPRCP